MEAVFERATSAPGRLWHRLSMLFAAAMRRDKTAAQPDAKDCLARAGALMDAYGDSILRLAYAYMHNLSDAEDILQDTLMTYLEHRPVFESAGHEKAWLLRVAINTSKNRLRYNRLRAHDELDEQLAAGSSPNLSFLWEAVRALPVKYAEVLHLFYQEGYSAGEIAGLLDKNESTVRSLMSRGRQLLKGRLKEDYDFEI